MQAVDTALLQHGIQPRIGAKFGKKVLAVFQSQRLDLGIPSLAPDSAAIISLTTIQTLDKLLCSQLVFLSK